MGAPGIPGRLAKRQLKTASVGGGAEVIRCTESIGCDELHRVHAPRSGPDAAAWGSITEQGACRKTCGFGEVSA